MGSGFASCQDKRQNLTPFPWVPDDLDPIAFRVGYLLSISMVKMNSPPETACRSSRLSCPKRFGTMPFSVVKISGFTAEGFSRRRWQMR